MKKQRSKGSGHRGPTLGRGACAFLLWCGLVGAALPCQPANALTEMTSQSATPPLFSFTFADKGERLGQDVSTYTLSQAQKADVVRAANLWAEVLGPGSRYLQGINFYVSTFNEVDDADCFSVPNNPKLPVAMSAVQEAIIQGTAPRAGAGVMRIGKLTDAKNGMPLSPLPDNNSFVGSIYHEIAHALGYSSYFSPDGSGGMSVWDTHLRDKYGRTLGPGVKLVDNDPVGTDPMKFLVGEGTRSGVTFHGAHLREVMGNDNGVVINGREKTKYDLSHTEFERSLMSHQGYRNFNTFLEAELAILQDLGYTIDRKNFFGHTVHGDGITLRNTQGYFARENGAWLGGKPNTATLGVGLHIYGHNNTVDQLASLLADGEAGTGARVDGSGNLLRIESGVKVTGNGPYGTGLLVAYGRNNAIISRGDIQAIGKKGVAACFDFGHNLVGDHNEYRGSWIWVVDEKNKALEENSVDESGFSLAHLRGPLVKSFDVSGLLKGAQASIYISGNAFVKNINILNGATVQGNIISDWDPNNSDISTTAPAANELHTLLTFGYQPKADGTASTKPAPGFDMVLDGGIFGAKSIDMLVAGGKLAVTDTVEVFSLENRGLLSLRGMDKQGRSAYVTDTFTNAASATTETEFLPDGHVGIIEAGKADIKGGTWAVRPSPGVYANRQPIRLQSPVDSDNIIGWFDRVAMLSSSSPTLTFSFLSKDVRSPVVMADRAPDAYSQYAKNNTGASVGRALRALSDDASDEMMHMLGLIDWSGEDGQGVSRALGALSPEAHDAVARASLSQQGEFNAMLLGRMLANRTMAPAGGVRGSASGDATGDMGSGQTHQWTVWGTPYGAYSWQGGHDGHDSWTSSGTGILAGADMQLESGLSVGLHVGVSARRTHVDGDQDASIATTSGFIGAQALFAPQRWDGCYITGQARVGLENGDMDRTISFPGYYRTHESRWTAPALGLLFGGGKDWTWRGERGALTAGPVAWLEYAALFRPEISESWEGPSALHTEATTYDSLQSAVGGHVGWNTRVAERINLSVDALAAWRHEWLEGTFRTNAYFRGYGNYPFTSETEISGRDALLLQGSARLSHDNGFFAQIEVSGEAFRSAATSIFAGLTLGLDF